MNIFVNWLLYEYQALVMVRKGMKKQTNLSGKELRFIRPKSLFGVLVATIILENKCWLKEAK